jgi:CheY-like chemotaxis protein/anti-sigma regulatory factor (Ser/Thr protein kinase)
MSITLEKSNIKLALVVDDSVMQCKVLSVLLKEEGYRVFTANDGARAVAMYIKYQPDLVLMDINMPIMNGYEAAIKIKSLSQENSLCPLIFITTMDTDKAFIDSIDAGGDGILVRPFSPEVFKAKIKSIQRISDLYAQVKTLQQKQQSDAELAEQLMSDVIEARNYALDKIGMIKKAAALFSGDIQLTALCPNGDVNVLLGDFTGHGLRSSIGAIPLAETFRSMSKKGIALFDIIGQVNRLLYDLLPSDLFLGATFLTVSANDDFISIFNAGLPDAYIYGADGQIKYKVNSSHPPMGILPSLITGTKLTILTVEPSDRVILISDGIVEARNEQGDMFEFERFENAAKAGVLAKSVSETVLSIVNEFCKSMPQEDDISLIDVPCGVWEQPFDQDKDSALSHPKPSMSKASNENKPSWSWELMLTGKRLVKANPIPMIIGYIKELEGEEEHWQRLYTILTEAYVNSLDHGVLGLSSELKTCGDGFVEYFKERESRLERLALSDIGFVSFKLDYYPFLNGGRINIIIQDSGDGFDVKGLYKKRMHKNNDNPLLNGRGIDLIEQLSDSFEYREKGTLIEVSYLWSKYQY